MRRDGAPHPGGASSSRWRKACAIVATLGIGVAILLWGPSAALVGVGMAGMVAGLLIVLTLEPGVGGLVETLRVPDIAFKALLLGSSAVALRAMLELSVPVTAVLVLPLVATSPPVVTGLAAIRRGRADDDVPGLTAGQRAEWRASSKALAGGASVSERLGLVEVRQSLLDAVFDDARPPRRGT